MWLDVKSVKGRKEGKDEEIKGKAIRPFEEVKRRSEVPKCEDWCNLEELHEWKQAKEKRKIERVRENSERYIVRKKAVSEKKKGVFYLFFCSSCISKCCNLYLI